MVSSQVSLQGLTAVVVGTYNEAVNIQKLAPEILKHNVQLVIVDDASPDGTAEKIKKLQQEYENIHLIERKGKLGYGSAYAEGFMYALKKLQAKNVISMDADLSHDPAVIPSLLEKARQYDVVIGSRYVEGGGTSWSLHRRMISKGANTLAKLLLGIPVNDVTSGYRLYKGDVLKNVDVTCLKSDGYSFLQEVLYKVYQKGAKIGEVPIFFQDRREGQSKLSKKEMAKFFFNLLRLRFKQNA